MKIIKQNIMIRHVFILIVICSFGTISNAQTEAPLPTQEEIELKERLE